MLTRTPSIKVIKAGKLIDGRDASLKERMAVVVEGGLVSRVVPQQEMSLPEGESVEELDFPEATLVPGLVDSHTHTNFTGTGETIEEMDEDGDDIHLLHATKNARIALESGVTTMRDNGGWRRVVFALKDGIRRGLVPGPSILASGRPITISGGHMWMLGSQADGETGVRAAVRQLVQEGADWIKGVASGGGTLRTMSERPSFTIDELKALVDESHRRNRLVGTHSGAWQSIVNSLDADVDMIIHCSFTQPDGTARYDPELGERIASSGVWVNPTLYVGRAPIERLQEKKREVGLTPDEEGGLDFGLRRIEASTEVCRQIISAGARIAAGSDAGWRDYRFGWFHRELAALTDAGFSDAQALIAGTRDAADALGVLDKVGTVEPGKEADLLLVDGDPTKDINSLANVVAVFKAGERVH